MAICSSKTETSCQAGAAPHPPSPGTTYNTMKVVLFGATGMIGQGVLRECLLDPEVTAVLSVARRTTGKTHAKLRELVHRDFLDFSSVANELSGYDACLFCLGVSSAGMSE